MALTVTELVESSSSGSSWTSGAFTCATGDLLIACVTAGDNNESHDFTITDNSGSGSWALISGDPFTAGTGVHDSAWWYKVANGSETTVTIGLENATAYDVSVSKISGWSGTPTLEDFDEDESYLASAASSTINSGSVTNTTANAIVLAFFTADGPSTIDAGRSVSDGASYTEGSETGAQVFLYYREVSSTGTYSPVYSFTDTGDQAYGASAVFGDVSAGANSGSGTITGTGTLEGTGKAVHYGNGTVTGTGALVGTGKATHYGNGTVSGTGTLVGEGYAPILGAAEGSGVVSGTGSLEGTGYALHSGAGEIAGTGTLVGEGLAPSTTSEGSGVVTGAGSLVGTGYALSQGSGVISGVGSLVGGGLESTVANPSTGGGRPGRTYAYPSEPSKKRRKASEKPQEKTSVPEETAKPYEVAGRLGAITELPESKTEAPTNVIPLFKEEYVQKTDLQSIIDDAVSRARERFEKVQAEKKVLQRLEQEETQLSWEETESLLLLAMVE